MPSRPPFREIGITARVPKSETFFSCGVRFQADGTKNGASLETRPAPPNRVMSEIKSVDLCTERLVRFSCAPKGIVYKSKNQARQPPCIILTARVPKSERKKPSPRKLPQTAFFSALTRPAVWLPAQRSERLKTACFRLSWTSRKPGWLAADNNKKSGCITATALNASRYAAFSSSIVSSRSATRSVRPVSSGPLSWSKSHQYLAFMPSTLSTTKVSTHIFSWFKRILVTIRP